MPEGDTIHKLARYLRPRLLGARANALRVGYRDTSLLLGHRITGVHAHGKHLFIDFDNDWTLRSHLGLYGSWHRYHPGERWKKPQRRASVVLETDEETYVCFNAREVQIYRRRGIDRRDLPGRLGPDLLDERLDLTEVVARARALLAPEAPLVDVLLDQRIACGIGNVYKSELLFLERRHPLQRLGELDDEALASLFGQARELLLRNLEDGPRSTREREDAEGPLWVYGRRGRPCLVCAAPVRYTRMGRHMRSTYWCPGCQGEDEGDAP